MTLSPFPYDSHMDDSAVSRTVHIPTLLHPSLTPQRLPDHSAASAHAPWPSWSPMAPSQVSRTVHIPTLLHPSLTPRHLHDHSAASAHAPWPSWSPMAPSEAIARAPRLSQASPHPLSPSRGPHSPSGPFPTPLGSSHRATTSLALSSAHKSLYF
jgi:hypothetical protein